MRILIPFLKVEGLVVVNIDEGTMTINSQRGPTYRLNSSNNSQQEFVGGESPEFCLPNLPIEPANIFKNICKKAKFQMELLDVQR